jgi:hypothetical protein
MDYLDFTAEESSLVAIYATISRTETITQITAALPYMDAGFAALAKGAAEKLAAMGDGDFDAMVFASDDDDTEGEDAHADHT